MEVGDRITNTVIDETNLWVVVTLTNRTCKIKLINGSNLGFIPSIDGTYAFIPEVINNSYCWFIVRELNPIKYINKHTL